MDAKRAITLWLLILGVSSAAQAATDATGQPVIRGHQDIRGLEQVTNKRDGTQIVSGKIAGNGDIPAAPKRRVITGVVSPGNSPGCVTDQGNVVFEGGSSLQIELGGATPCTGYDQYTVNLSLTLNGGSLNISLYNGYVPAVGATFDILNWGTLTGTFGTLNLPTLPANLTWDTSKLYTTGVIAVAAVDTGSTDTPLPLWGIVALAMGLFTIAKRQVI